MGSSRLIDYHLHTAVTIDCNMSESQVCARALEMGMAEIAFTNHVMLTQPDYYMSPGAFAAHWGQIQACQLRNPELTIRLGIEMDYYPGREREIAATLRKFEELIGRPFDIVLGAIHDLHGEFFSNKKFAQGFFEQHDLLALYHEYFSVSIAAVKSGLFDVIAHPDLIKKYTHDLSPFVPFDQYKKAVEPFIESLLHSGVGIEVNTKGLSIKLGEMYPSKEFLELYLSTAKAGGKEPILTLGSDAHTVEIVGKHIATATQILREMGVGSVMSFERRRHAPFPI